LISSLQIDHAGPRAEQVKFHLDYHTFSEVLVMQQYAPTSVAGDFQLMPTDRLPDSYVLEPVVERRFGGHLDRISRVVAINLPPAAAPDAKPPASLPAPASVATATPP
jgi:hypothetical protein